VEEEIKILLDDEPNVLNAINRTVTDESYTVLTARSGQEGLDILRKTHVNS